MLDIFNSNYDAVQRIKELQTDHCNGNTLLRIGCAFTQTIEGFPKRGSTIIRTIGSAIHDKLKDVGNLDEKVIRYSGDPADKIIRTTGGAIKDTTSSIGSIFHGKYIPRILW